METKRGIYADVPDDEGVNINPELLRKLNETLDLLDENKSLEFINYVFTYADKVTEKARQYAEAHNEDYRAVLRKMMDEDKEFVEGLSYFRKSK